MSIATFNTYLLRKCTKNLRLGPDVRSLLRRYQTLSIIYANFVILLMVGFFEVFSLFYGLEYHYIMLVISPFVILSFISLKKGNNDLAAISVLMYLHLGNRYASNFCKASLTALATLFMFPNFSYFMSSSTKVQVINLIMCGLQAVGHIYNFREIFSVTMTPDQSAEIQQLTAATLGVFSFLCVISFLQKNLESNMWQLNYLDQEKAEQITKEVMQAVEAKEAFISSLSHEIRNPLNSMSGSISYLLEVVKDPQHRQILNNAKLSGEILLNLINNLLDTAKLKSEKMELSYSETDLVEVFKKALTINSEKLKKGKLYVDTFISKEIPKVIWSDPSRLLQIMMNLISNCIKFTPEEGKMTIYASWCDEDEDRKALLAPLGSVQASKIGIASKRAQQSPHNELKIITSARSDKLSPDYNGGFEEFTSRDIKSFSKNLSIRPIEIKTLGQVNNANVSRDVSDLGSEDDKPWSIERVEMNWSKAKPSQTNLRYQRTQSSKRGYLKIQISDTGCGIAEESIPKLFEMFTQANRTITSSHGGTGLGLWICKQLCQKMGGDIKLASKVGKGTDFVFYIAVQNETLLDPTYSQPFRDFRSSDKVAALVADDYGYNRDLHKLLLQREGIDVALACDGEEAFKIYSNNPKAFDFVLMDIQMPKMDGFTAAKKIRELEVKNEWKKVDIYFVSAEYYSEEEVIASFKASSGIKEMLGIRCLKKPVDIVTIKTLVERYKKKNS